jgi:hypothetical protein
MIYTLQYDENHKIHNAKSFLIKHKLINHVKYLITMLCSYLMPTLYFALDLYL